MNIEQKIREMCSALLDMLRAQKESKAVAEAATHSVRYDLCALYVLCNPVSLSLYSLPDRVTPWLSLCLITITLCAELNGWFYFITWVKRFDLWPLNKLWFMRKEEVTDENKREKEASTRTHLCAPALRWHNHLKAKMIYLFIIMNADALKMIFDV